MMLFWAVLCLVSQYKDVISNKTNLYTGMSTMKMQYDKLPN